MVYPHHTSTGKAPIAPLMLDQDSFYNDVLNLWVRSTSQRASFTEWYDERLLACDVDWWIARADLLSPSGRTFTQLMFVVCHNKVRRIRISMVPV